MLIVIKHNHYTNVTTELKHLTDRAEAEHHLHFEHDQWSRYVGTGGTRWVSPTGFLVTDTSGEPHYSFELIETP